MMQTSSLTFTPEEVASNYPAFFKKYSIPAQDTALGSILEHNFNHDKKNLREFFPVDGTGRVKIASYENSEQIMKVAFVNTIRMLSQAQHHDIIFTTEELLHNRYRKTGAKLSRVLVNSYKTNPEFKQRIERWLNNTDLCLELPLLPLAKRTDFEVILQNFYSEIAKTKDVHANLYFTVSPYDIVNASNGGRFSSCNSINGEHKNAPICASASPTMALIKLESSAGEMLGRCYIAMSPDFKSFVVQPTYGYMKEEFIKDAEMWICSVINSKLGDAKWEVVSNLDTIHPRYVSDCTVANFYVDASARIYLREDHKELPAIRLGDCHCLICGELGIDIVCGNCKNVHFKKCKLCGKLCDKANQLCPDCKSVAVQCIECGRLYRPDKRDLVQKCNECARRESVCLVCGKTIAWLETYSLESQDLKDVLGGVFKIHTFCDKKQLCCTLKAHSKCKCGRHKDYYNHCCAWCAVTQSGIIFADNAMHEMANFKNRIQWNKRGVEIQISPNVILPEYNYAIAA